MKGAAAVTIVRGQGASGEDTLASDVRAALSGTPKVLGPKHLYDERGSGLYERITTEAPEYYPARCEREILNRRVPELTAGARELVELGSGIASKTRALLYALAASGSLRRYVPFDVSEDVVEQCAAELIELFPGLRVHGVVGDFERDLERLPPGERRVFAFLGGTIGNLHTPERERFLGRLRDLMGPHDRLLLGTDLVKDTAVIEAAYNDSQGVTAEFNRNVLRVVNAGLEADFDPDAFSHRAFFDPDCSRIEMRLRADGRQHVRIPGAGLAVSFADGEELRTEISTKFTPEAIKDELASAGLAVERFLTDSKGLFGLTLASRRP